MTVHPELTTHQTTTSRPESLNSDPYSALTPAPGPEVTPYPTRPARARRAHTRPDRCLRTNQSLPRFEPLPPDRFVLGVDDTLLGYLDPRWGSWTRNTWEQMQARRDGIPADEFWASMWRARWWPERERLGAWLRELFSACWISFCKHGRVIYAHEQSFRRCRRPICGCHQPGVYPEQFLVGRQSWNTG